MQRFKNIYLDEKSNRNNQRIKTISPKIFACQVFSCTTQGLYWDLCCFCLFRRQLLYTLLFFFIRTFVWKWILNIFLLPVKQSLRGTEVLAITWWNQLINTHVANYSWENSSLLIYQKISRTKPKHFPIPQISTSLWEVICPPVFQRAGEERKGNNTPNSIQSKNQSTIRRFHKHKNWMTSLWGALQCHLKWEIHSCIIKTSEQKKYYLNIPQKENICLATQPNAVIL